MHQTPLYDLDPSTTAMLIVDAQRAFGEVVPVPDHKLALSHVRQAALGWQKRGGLVVATQHLYQNEDEVGSIRDFIPGIYEVLKEGSPYAEFHPELKGCFDRTVRKTAFNAFIGTTLEQQLRERGITTIVVCGFTTPICVEGTIRGAHERGFRVLMLEDACASQPIGEVEGLADNEVARHCHAQAVARMSYVFAEVLRTHDFLERIIV